MNRFRGIALGAALLVVGGAGFLYLKLGVVAKAAIERLGPRLTGAPVSVTAVTVSPFSGKGRVRSLTIGSPKGWSGDALTLRDVSVAVDLKTVRGRRILIKEIVVLGPELSFEGSLSGSNLAAIQRNVAAASPAPAEPSGEDVKVEIELFKVTGGKVNVRVKELGGSGFTVALPDVELRDIGKSRGGVTPAEAAKEMLGAVTGSALKAATGGITKEVSKNGAGLIKDLFGR